jgi:hypothetical protein
VEPFAAGQAGGSHAESEAGAAGDRLVITLADPAAQNPAIVRTLVEQGAAVQFVNEVKHSLEDVYLSLIHNGGQGAGGEA